MDLAKLFLEEDMFPREITSWIERPYGFLFFNEENKDSYDSNHALIFRDKVKDLDQVLDEILRFYTAKGITPSIYQSISDDGYFEQIGDELTCHGFDFWTETQNYMVLSEENRIWPNPNITVEKVTQWETAFATHIFEAAGEPWEIDVAKNALSKANTLFFVAYNDDVPVGMTHCHVADGVCRVDYLLVATNCRNKGVGRALIHYFAEYCAQNHIENCYLWPDGETAEKIYQEAGFRTVAVKQAGRATYHAHEDVPMNITFRRFVESDAAEVSALITKTLRITNSKDYSSEYIEKDVAQFTPEKVIERASWTHFYVFCDSERIVGCGAIGPYWGSETESSLFNIFVLPEYQGKGVGRKIIETLEADEYALRANRIEIPASITACAFYRKMGYDHKNGIDTVDAEQLYRLEKFR